MACLEALPAEVLDEIVDLLIWDPDVLPPGHENQQCDSIGSPSYARHHSVLARSCRRLYSILNPLLYRRNIERDADINSCVLWAAARGRLGTIKIAHGLGADLDLVGPKSRYALEAGGNGLLVTPLHLALENSHLDIVEYLLEHGANVHQYSTRRCHCFWVSRPYALHTALSHSKKPEETAQMLVRHGAYLVSEDEPAITFVMEMGYQDLLQLMLQQRRPETTASVLHYAIRTGNSMLIRDLIERPELDVLLQINGMSSLEVAVYFGNKDAVHLLLDRPEVNADDAGRDGLTPLHYAVSRRHLDILHTLLTLRPDTDINVPDTNGRSPFHGAARHGDVEAMKALVQYPNVDIDLRDHSGRTPLHLAGCSKDYDAIRFLIKQPGVQPLAVDDFGFNVLHFLATGKGWAEGMYEYDDEYDRFNGESRDEDDAHTNADKVKAAEQMIKELMSIGISIDQETSYCGTALRMAIRFFHFPVALALLACGCDATIGFEGISGWTMLHDCLRRPADGEMQTDLVKQLVSRGVNVDTAITYDRSLVIRDKNGDRLDRWDKLRYMYVGATPLYLAALHAHNIGSMEVLLDAGADPNASIARFDRGYPTEGDLYYEPFLVCLCGMFSGLKQKSVGEVRLLVKHGAKMDELGDGDVSALLLSMCVRSVMLEMLEHATGENICREHVQSQIDDWSGSRMDFHGQPLLVSDLEKFRDRVFGG